MPDNIPSNKYATCDLFSSRDTMEEAMSYANSIVEALPHDERAAVYTALYVVSNTALRLMAKLDITQIQPRASGERPDGFRLQDLTAAEAQIIVRELLPKMAMIAFAGSDMGLPFADDLGMFLGAITTAYGVPVTQLADETNQLRKSGLGSRE